MKITSTRYEAEKGYYFAVARVTATKNRKFQIKVKSKVKYGNKIDSAEKNRIVNEIKKEYLILVKALEIETKQIHT